MTQTFPHRPSVTFKPCPSQATSNTTALAPVVLVSACSWCQREQGITPQPNETHTICPRHKAKWISDLEFRARNGVDSTAPEATADRGCLVGHAKTTEAKTEQHCSSGLRAETRGRSGGVIARQPFSELMLANSEERRSEQTPNSGEAGKAGKTAEQATGGGQAERLAPEVCNSVAAKPSKTRVQFPARPPTTTVQASIYQRLKRYNELKKVGAV